MLTQAAGDKGVAAVLITGNGRGFCADQDLNDRAVGPGESMPDLGESVDKWQERPAITRKALKPFWKNTRLYYKDE